MFNLCFCDLIWQDNGDNILTYILSPGRVLFFRNQAKTDFRYLMNIHYARSGESLDSLEYSCMIKDV